MANDTSKASQPVKAGEVPVNVRPHVSAEKTMQVAATKIEAMLKGGVTAITYISAALLVAYLEQKTGSGKGTRLSVIRDEFRLMLGKRGLGGTQTAKYLDYANTLSAKMNTDCGYGKEMAALIAADTPEKAHDAVDTWLRRHTVGKSTEHGTKLAEASQKLNMLEVFLGKVDDPGKPEILETDATKRQKAQKAQKQLAARIDKDPAVLKQINADRLLETVSNVAKFPVLVEHHVAKMINPVEIMAELEAITAAYKARIAALSQTMGKKAKKPAPKASDKPRVAA